MKNQIVIIITCFIIFITGCFNSDENIIHVPGDYETIQAAIDAALDGDEILIADAVYTGQGNKDLHWDAAVKHIKIRSENGPAYCIIDCESNGRGFKLTQGQTRSDVIDGLTIKNGCVMDSIPNGIKGGGAILIDSASPIIKNCIISANKSLGNIDGSNYAGDGGAINCINGSNPSIYNNTIKYNEGGHTGGGIHMSASGGIIDNNFIFFNLSHSCYGGGGIALVNESNPDITDNVIYGNGARKIDISGIQSSGFGGGIMCLNSNPNIINNTIILNTTNYAGAEGQGGGIRVRGLPFPVIANSIIRYNYAADGFENMDFDLPDTIDISYCNIEGGIGSINVYKPETIINADPLFVQSVPPYNLNLQSTSPCIDSGAPNLNGIPFTLTDIEGNIRISGTTIDIGAYEYEY